MRGAASILAAGRTVPVLQPAVDQDAVGEEVDGEHRLKPLCRPAGAARHHAPR